MFKSLIELIGVLFTLGFLYVVGYAIAFAFMVGGIIYVIQSNPNEKPSIDQQEITLTDQLPSKNITSKEPPKITSTEPLKKVQVKRLVCKRIDGCPEKNGTCPTCVVEKVWE